MPVPSNIFRGSVTYWVGEILECSNPAWRYSDDLPDRDAAEAWGAAHVGLPSPWPGRDFDDYYEVVEYEPVHEHGVTDWEPVKRWIYSGGTVDEVTV